MAIYANGKRSLRQFQCSDVLWATFQRMAEEQDRDIGDLIKIGRASCRERV